MSAVHQIPELGVSTGAGNLLTVQICRSWAELEQYRQVWSDMLQANSRSTIFQTPEWLAAWWQAFNQNKNLLVLIFKDSENNLVGIVPLYSERRWFIVSPFTVLRFVGAGSGDSDALDFITLPGYERDCAETFLAWLTNEAEWSMCALETLPGDSLVAQHLSALMKEADWRVESESTPNFIVDLPQSWQEYLDRLDSQFRPLLTRYPKRLQSRYKVNIVRCERVDDLEKNLQRLFELHQMRWTGRGEPGAFASTERRNFYRSMSQAFLKRGWLEFWLLSLENEVVAMQFCFRYHNIVSLLQEGFHPKYTAEKVGYALRSHVLQEMIRTGAKQYDFLGGADAYKAKFAARQSRYLTLSFAGPSPLGRIYLTWQHQKQQLKQWLKNNLPAALLAKLRPEPSKQAAGPLTGNPHGVQS
ncbi:MAG TPA: GNAT family N-acetyltransferase [Candidatus Angelobacter sp.]|nr:GNAT family N-acetyltransferase [Candidatus Angelobacter sp.]